MIYLADIRDWLKEYGLFEHYYVGKLDSKQEKSLGVYQRKTVQPPKRAIGNLSSYEVKPISLLIHWNKNATETEKTAFELYKQLEAVSQFMLNNTKIYMLSLLQSEPVDVGTDESGIYERVIEFDIYYERRK